MKLPFDESGLVWTAQSIVLPSIPGKLLPENFHRKFNPHVETAPKEQLIPTREAQARQLMNQKKKTCFAGLFFLTGLRPVLPLGQCPPSKPYTL